MPRERLLILSVDRDNDIGQKIGVKAPIIGREKVLEVATSLALKDPEESDANAMFGSLKIMDELKDKYDVEVAIIAGHRNRGIEADREISKQLGNILKKRPSDFVVFVSDGADDEYIIPIIQSQIPILSVKRIVVRQSQVLESGYYKIKDFLKETLDNPRFARLVFGLPSVALILYALFDIQGWRFIVGFVGAYLFIKGFKLEDYILGAFEEFKESFTKRRFVFFTYIVSIAVGTLGVYRAYNSVMDFVNIGIFEMTAAFFIASIYFFWISGTIAWLGRNISYKNRKTSRIASIPLFGLAVSIVIYNAGEIILDPNISSFNFIISIGLGFVIALIALALETVD